MIMGVTHAHLAPIWYHSEPSNVQCLGWDLCLLFLTANGSNMCCFYAVKTRQLQKFLQIYFLNFLHFLDVHFKSFIYLFDRFKRQTKSEQQAHSTKLLSPSLCFQMSHKCVKYVHLRTMKRKVLFQQYFKPPQKVLNAFTLLFDHVKKTVFQ